MLHRPHANSKRLLVCPPRPLWHAVYLLRCACVAAKPRVPRFCTLKMVRAHTAHLFSAAPQDPVALHRQVYFSVLQNVISLLR